MEEFKFREGFHAPKGVTAKQVAEELERIERVTGRIDAPTIVALSEDKDAVLHVFFEWDDSEAARKYRENQASHVATSVKVVDTTTGDERFLRLSAKKPDEERRQYLTMATILSDKDLIESARDELMRQFNGLNRSLDIFEGTVKRAGKSTAKITQSRKHLQKAVAAIGGI